MGQKTARAMGDYWAILVQYALVRFRVPYLEVDIGDFHSANRLFAILDLGGDLRMHIASTKFPPNPLEGSRSLIFFLGGMGV